jgi:hypothetical protein
MSAVLRITPTNGPKLQITPSGGSVLHLAASGGPTLHLTSMIQTGNAMRGLSGFCSGKVLPLVGGELVAGGQAPYDYVATAAGVSAVSKVAATAQTTFTITKDDVLLGYLVFAPGSKIGIATIVSGAVLKGQYVGIRGNAVPDATLADITFLVTEG